MELDPAFWQQLGLWVHADSPESSDHAGKLENAELAASTMSDMIADLRPLIDSLGRYLEGERRQEVTRQFIDRTNIDWMASENDQQQLEQVVRRILDRLKEEQARREAARL